VGEGNASSFCMCVVFARRRLACLIWGEGGAALFCLCAWHHLCVRTWHRLPVCACAAQWRRGWRRWQVPQTACARARGIVCLSACCVRRAWDGWVKAIRRRRSAYVCANSVRAGGRSAGADGGEGAGRPVTDTGRDHPPSSHSRRWSSPRAPSVGYTSSHRRGSSRNSASTHSRRVLSSSVGLCSYGEGMRL
jgi:hypothetical protein